MTMRLKNAASEERSLIVAWLRTLSTDRVYRVSRIAEAKPIRRVSVGVDGAAQFTYAID